MIGCEERILSISGGSGISGPVYAESLAFVVAE